MMCILRDLSFGGLLFGPIKHRTPFSPEKKQQRPFDSFLELYIYTHTHTDRYREKEGAPRARAICVLGNELPRAPSMIASVGLAIAQRFKTATAQMFSIRVFIA